MRPRTSLAGGLSRKSVIAAAVLSSCFFTGFPASFELFSGSVAMAQEASFDGVTAEDNVQLRAGAGNSYYVVGSLPKGAEARVVELVYGWSKIAPPAGSFSYIQKIYVDAAADGKSGKINADKSPVNAASLTGPGDSFRRQLTLKPGDSVTILGEEGNFFKIAPPAGAFVFAPPGAIRRKSLEEPTAPKVTAPAAAAPAPAPAPAVNTPKPAPAPAVSTPKPAPAPAVAPVVAAPKPAPTPAPAPAVREQAPDPNAPVLNPPPVPAIVTPATADVVEPTNDPEAKPTGTGIPVDTTTGKPTKPLKPAAVAEKPVAPAPRPAPAVGVGGLPAASSARVQALEQRVAQTMTLPLEQQPFDELIAGYEQALRDPTLPPLDRRIAAARINQYKRNAELASALKQLTQTQDAVKNAPPIKIEPMTARRVPNNGPDSNYNAVGQLLASSVYNGTNLPSLFRIVDAGNGRTIAYVKPVQPLTPLEWAAMLGKTVGVVGEAKYDPGLKLRVIDVRKVDLLSASEPGKESVPAGGAATDR
jgi:hypothetical protein